MSSKKLKAQVRIFNELETQLLTQAEMLGIKEDFSNVRMIELEYEALKKHLISFFQEKSNLEYEMQMLGTNKKETLIKLERLGIYIRRAEGFCKAYEIELKKMLDTLTQDQLSVQKLNSHCGVSTLVGGA